LEITEQRDLRDLSDQEVIEHYSPLVKQLLGEPDPYITLARGGKNAEGQDTIVLRFWNDEADHDDNLDDPCGTMSLGLLNRDEEYDGTVRLNIAFDEDEESQKVAKDIVQEIIGG
jgi:hypothetical protein